jgi:hypothetical protein
MVESVIALLIALGILAVVYVVFKWAVGSGYLPGPLLDMGNIVFAIIAIIIVLRFLLKLL